LLYELQAKSGQLPLPAGKRGKFAPVSLGDVAQLAAVILTGKGEHGFDDVHRGELITLTGPAMMAGEELAEAASQALEKKMTFKAISEYIRLTPSPDLGMKRRRFYQRKQISTNRRNSIFWNTIHWFERERRIIFLLLHSGTSPGIARRRLTTSSKCIPRNSLQAKGYYPRVSSDIRQKVH
jgi:hypothetical protein